MRIIRTVVTAVCATVGMAAAVPAAAQSTSGSASDSSGLTVVRCDAAANNCGGSEEPDKLTAPVLLGSAGRAQVLSPNLRSTEVALDTAEYRVLIPGCTPRAAGIFDCATVHQYQHCRTLMFSHMVHSCRADLAFQGEFATPIAAQPGSYRIKVKSNARMRVERGDRGFGQIRGSADVVLAIDLPADYADASCLQRDKFVYWRTGPKGGMSDIEDMASCDEPIEFSFAPHEDDLLRAHDICETFAAWGDEIEDSIEILAAGLFHIRSDNPEFREQYLSGIAIIAPFVEVTAPVTIDCRE